MKRGWLSVYQDRCDICRKFVNANSPGVSWSRQWSYDFEGVPDLHDETYRFSPCTDKHGIKPTNCCEDRGKYHGRNLQSEPSQSTVKNK